MTKLRKVLILDDDTRYSGLLALKLRMRYPEILVTARTTPDVIAGYNVYILDNDFGGSKMGAVLAEKVRQLAPDSLVIVLSGTLEFGLLKRLVNCHAAGVFDKSRDSELSDLMHLIDQYLIASSTQARSAQDGQTSASALTKICAILSQWNKRLAFEEKRLS